ncbi:MAG: hypothetical protein U0T81_09020 [Saprospiraceae bacterium]
MMKQNYSTQYRDMRQTNTYANGVQKDMQNGAYNKETIQKKINQKKVEYSSVQVMLLLLEMLLRTLAIFGNLVLTIDN